MDGYVRTDGIRPSRLNAALMETMSWPGLTPAGPWLSGESHAARQRGGQPPRRPRQSRGRSAGLISRGSGYSERLRPLRRMTSPYSTPTTPAKAIRARKRCIGGSPGVLKHRLCPTGGEACWREDIPNLVLFLLDFLVAYLRPADNVLRPFL